MTSVLEWLKGQAGVSWVKVGEAGASRVKVRGLLSKENNLIKA